jgi:hypothetical protein
MKPIKDGSAIFCCSRITLRGFFTKILRYVIQLFTASAPEHTTFFVNNKVSEINGHGAVFIPYDEWYKSVDKETKLYVVEPLFEFSSKQIKAMDDFCQLAVGRKYGAGGAIYSFLDEIKLIRDLDYKSKKEFCSGLTFKCFVAGGIFSPQEDKLTPIELRKKLTKSGIFTRKWRKIKD